jgi:hypothetical protein
MVDTLHDCNSPPRIVCFDNVHVLTIRESHERKKIGSICLGTLLFWAGIYGTCDHMCCFSSFILGETS